MAKLAGYTAGAETHIIPVQLSDLANAQTYKLPVPYAFTLNSILFRTGKPSSTSSKLATVQAQITGVACTGGAVALTTANTNATGGTVAGSAITALNVGVAGDTLEAAISSVTAFVEGDGWIEFKITPSL